MCPRSTDVRRGHIDIFNKSNWGIEFFIVQKDKNTEIQKKALKIRNYL